MPALFILRGIAMCNKTMKLRFTKDIRVDGVIRYAKGTVADVPTEGNSHLHCLKRGAVEVVEGIKDLSNDPEIQKEVEDLVEAVEAVEPEVVVEEEVKKPTKSVKKKASKKVVKKSE